MFMRHGYGMPLNPVEGEWLVRGQPDDWTDTDPVMHGIYNRNISVTMNVLPGTVFTVLMKAGDEIIYNAQEGADLVFESYPAEFTDGYQSVPSGINKGLIGLQFLETRIIVREKEYYEKKPPITVEIQFKYGPLVFTRKYDLKLSWDHYYSGKNNPFVTDLSGVPFIEKHHEWHGWQPLTGEYIYNRVTPEVAQVYFNGYWVCCFWKEGEVKLDFPSFAPFQRRDGITITGKNAVSVSLDLCSAGMDNMKLEASLWERVEWSPSDIYYLLHTSEGTYVAQNPHAGDWHMYFVDVQLTGKTFASLLTPGKEIWSHHDYDHDPLAHHRVKLGTHTFWEVFRVDHPAPGFGGTYGGSYPGEFKYGIMNYIAQYPRWYTRVGSFPVEG